MIRSRIALTVAVSLLILGMALYTYFSMDQESMQAIPAAINRGCAPWDGAAFTVDIPVNDGTVINISIWRSPEIKLPVTFTFPDNTGQVGNAILRPQTGMPESLNGTAFFWRVDQENPVDGRFELRTEDGKVFKGQFKAEWGDVAAMCG